MIDIPATLRHFAGEISGVSQNFRRDICYEKAPLHRLYDVILQAAGKIEDLEKRTIEPGHIKMPTTADEAVAMNLISESWLRTNAPERLKPREPDGTFVGDRRRQYIPCDLNDAGQFYRDGHTWMVVGPLSSDGEVALCEVVA